MWKVQAPALSWRDAINGLDRYVCQNTQLATGISAIYRLVKNYETLSVSLMYTDSMACKHIACDNSKLGKVRHLAIRTHLVRCHVSLGDIELVWCTTESMVADVMTKIVLSAQDKRLTIRFYNDVDLPLSPVAPEPKVGDVMRNPKTKRQKDKKWWIPKFDFVPGFMKKKTLPWIFVVR